MTDRLSRSVVPDALKLYCPNLRNSEARVELIIVT
jgi:hypothetical protein